ncbi:MAG TPA: Ig-like domain-containing protein, partial [Candidatus Thermoplasmatota archaeon]|nr:Ig-like domain-containing protein [Candidatus Thermoplasmatota archaeon]
TVDASVTGEFADQVSSVKFFIDDQLVGEDENPPFSWKWDKSSFGLYHLSVTAYDGNELLSSTSREVLKIL